ncbi:MAG: Peptide chain release factor 3, partial [uncultured Nocardioidaceae bacterium]
DRHHRGAAGLHRGGRAGEASSHVRHHQSPRRRQVHADRGAGTARQDDLRGGRRPRQGRPPVHRLGLAGHGEGARHLHHVDGAAVRVRRHRREPARHPRARRLLGGHVPGAGGRRRGGDAGGRRQGARAADAEAVRGLPPQPHTGDHRRQQVGPARPVGARAAGRDRAPHRAQAHAAHLAGGHGRRLPWRAEPVGFDVQQVHPYARRPHDGRRGRAVGRRRTGRPGCGLGRHARGARPAVARRQRPRPGGVPRRSYDAGAVHLGRPQLRRASRPGRAGRARAGAGGTSDRVRRRPGPRRRLQRGRVQDAGGHGLRPPRPAGLRPHLLRPLRPGNGGHLVDHGPVVRHQVRALGLRPGAHGDRCGLPRRRGGSRQRRCPRDRGHVVRGQAGDLSADPPVHAGALHERAGARQRPLQAVPARAHAARPGRGGPRPAFRPARRAAAGAGRGRPDAVRGRDPPDVTRVRGRGGDRAPRLLRRTTRQPGAGDGTGRSERGRGARVRVRGAAGDLHRPVAAAPYRAGATRARSGPRRGRRRHL